MNVFWAGLSLMLIGLKLGEVIDWSWWLVLLPVYIAPLGALIIFLVALAIQLAFYTQSRK